MKSVSGESHIPDQSSVGEIKQLMAQQKVSQAELARRIEVSAPLISQVFNGRKRLTSRVAKKILKALESPPQNILDPSPKKRRGRKRGSHYDYGPHLQDMENRMVQDAKLSVTRAAKAAVAWAAENNHAVVSFETLRKHFRKMKKEPLSAERRRQSQRRGTPSSCASDQQGLARKLSRQMPGGPHSLDEATGLHGLKKALGDLGDGFLSSPEHALSSYLSEDLEMLLLKGIVGGSAYSDLPDSMRSAIKTLQLASDPDFDPFAPETLSELVGASLPATLRTPAPDSPQIRQLRRAISQRAKELSRSRY